MFVYMGMCTLTHADEHFCTSMHLLTCTCMCIDIYMFTSIMIAVLPKTCKSKRSPR